MLLKVGVHKALTDVNAAESLRVASMVGCVSVPDVVTYDGALASAVFLDAPDSGRLTPPLHLITIEVVKEVALEDCIVLE